MWARKKSSFQIYQANKINRLDKDNFWIAQKTWTSSSNPSSLTRNNLSWTALQKKISLLNLWFQNQFIFLLQLSINMSGWFHDKKQISQKTYLGNCTYFSRDRRFLQDTSSNASNRKNQTIFVRHFFYKILFLSDRHFAHRWRIEKNL